MNNYIDISKQQRVVFVDNIPYDDAKALSTRYPFAIIMTDTNKDQNYNNGGGHHTIWRGGKCYSYISAVDNTPVTINTYSISLNISPTGKLSLNIGSAITDYKLFQYFREGNEIVTYIENLDNSYENTENKKQYIDALTIKNIGNLYFHIYGINEELLNEYNKDGLDLFDFKLFKINDENADLLSTYISNIRSQKDLTIQGIKYVFNVKEEYLDNDLILEVSYKLLDKTKTKRYHIILHKTLTEQFYWVGSGDPRINYQVPEEISNDYLQENRNWHILENGFANHNNNPISVSGGNIHVIIPSNKKLRVMMMHDNETVFYIVDEDEQSNDYSYEILDNNILINNENYKLLRLRDTEINEFTNIIQ